MLIRTTETSLFIPVTSCLNLSTSQKFLCAPSPMKYFLYFTDFRICHRRNLGLMLCTRDGSTDYLTHLLSQMHTLLWTCRSSKSVISGMTTRVIAIVVWRLVNGSQKMHIPFHTGLVSNQIWDKFRVKTRGKEMFSFLGLSLSASISDPPTEIAFTIAYHLSKIPVSGFPNFHLLSLAVWLPFTLFSIHSCSPPP